ncbi:catechol 2,3-dioxygenase-like lactoylglutathione lyase family enzyme [Bradyrhizobium niftali]
MRKELPPPVPRLTVITLGVSDIRASIAFYDALGFSRRLKATGEAVAFYDTGGPVLALFHWDQLAADAALPDKPRPTTFRGITLAWNCRAREEVDAVLAFAVDKGAALLKAAHETDYGGYFRLFRRPRRPSLGSRGRAGHRGR